MMRRVLIAASLIFLGVVTGCGGDSGPPRFRISGDATHDGQPIPNGDILFTPDGAKGNSGPQGIATIKEGKFDTAALGGQGIAGGATIIRVTGLNGTKLLCEYEYEADLPKQDSTLTVTAPANLATPVAPSNETPVSPEI